MQVTDAGIFSPIPIIPGDPSSLDDHKLKDIYLLFFYSVDAEIVSVAWLDNGLIVVKIIKDSWY